jgi:hypothetical protein
MMSLETDFEMHAIWQGYVEDPAAKVFVARNARTHFMQSARNITINIYSQVGNSLGIPYPGCTALLSGAYVTRESVGPTIFVSKKGMIHVHPTDVRTRNFWRERQKSSYFEKPRVLCLNFGGVCTTYS